MYLEIGVSFCPPPPQSFFSNFSPTTQHRKANEVSIQHIFFRGTRWHHRCLGICQCLADPFVMAFPGLSSPNTTLIIPELPDMMIIVGYDMESKLGISWFWWLNFGIWSIHLKWHVHFSSVRIYLRLFSLYEKWYNVTKGMTLDIPVNFYNVMTIRQNYNLIKMGECTYMCRLCQPRI